MPPPAKRRSTFTFEPVSSEQLISDTTSEATKRKDITDLRHFGEYLVEIQGHSPTNIPPPESFDKITLARYFCDYMAGVSFHARPQITIKQQFTLCQINCSQLGTAQYHNTYALNR